MTNHQLIAICDVCNQQVQDHDGHLSVHRADIRAHQKAVAEWKQRTGSDHADGAPHAVGIMDMAAYPEPAKWTVLHVRCCEHPEAGEYPIEIHRVRTWPDLVAWTAHLMGKTWLGHTDWSELLEAATNGDKTRLVAATPPRLSIEN
jgi:hypothetical protein